jgi:hypothetical protein
MAHFRDAVLRTVDLQAGKFANEIACEAGRANHRKSNSYSGIARGNT